MKEVKIALLGAGTVGSKVAQILEAQNEELSARAGARLRLSGVAVRDAAKTREGIDPALLSTDIDAVIDGAQLVIELMGGLEPARAAMLKALKAGKTVVTGNKAVLAAHGPELYEAAETHDASLYFEAAVAGAVPVVYGLRESLAGDRVQKILGIVNGTTNFILDQMSSQGWDYETALAEAQRLGYAEADPTADVEGYDAASKAAILASLAFHTRVTADDVHCEGITNITAHDIQAAKAAGYTIKLLAICDRLKDEAGHESIAARVHPTLVPRNHPLANVHKSFNAVFVEAEAAGRLMFYGNGAGGNPTASAVLGDIVGAGRNKVFGGRAPGESTYANLPIANFGDIPTRFHIDMTVVDIIGVLAELTKIFAAHGISLRTVRQEEGTEKNARLLVMTHEAKESDLAATVETLKDTPSVIKVNSVIRMVGE